MSNIIPLSEEDLHDLYLWVDSIPISRPKRNIARDFSDGSCVAEIVKHFFSKLVDLHNYSPANGIPGKISNWNTLNTRVFRKLYFEVPDEEIRDITAAVPGSIERFLRALRTKINQIQQRQSSVGGAFHSTPQEASNVRENPTSSTRSCSRQAASQNSNSNGPRVKGPSLEITVDHKHHNQDNINSGEGGYRYSNNGGETRSRQSSPNREELLRQLDQKDEIIMELKEAVAILTNKVIKLEELVEVQKSTHRGVRRK
eukprot:Tbor_TRINITY_DN5529_c1_g14::TRINITY_DN5529_c1_g14_i1::g.12968::m.12968